MHLTALRRVSAIRARARTFVRDRRGNILMIFGFALIPITFATGMGVDYAGAMRIQTKVAAVADAAALSGVTKTLMQTRASNACYAARLLFNSQAPSTGLTLDTTRASDLTITVTDSPTNGNPDTVTTCPVVNPPIDLTLVPLKKRVVTLTWSGTSKNTFSGVLGMNTLPVKGTATAQATVLPYIDVHMVLDTSQSMGLAASDADAQALWNATKLLNGNSKGCTFGCHVFQDSEGGKNPSKLPNEQIAANNNIKLRVNVLRDATTDMIQTAIDSEGTNNTYRFGLYRIGRTLGVISDLTTNLPAAKITASGLTLGDNDNSGVGDTNLLDTMAQMYGKIGVHGDGSTQANARAFMFIVTDGVTDLRQDQADLSDPSRGHGGCTYGHCTKPIDAATCQRYRDANITVGIVYTTYLPVKADPFNPLDPSLRPEYQNLVKSFSWPGYSSPNPSDNSRDIAPALQACASPGWYFEASDATTIHAAMQRLFQQASQSATITH